jgi:uncharacterized RDD family membrane protein YckC
VLPENVADTALASIPRRIGARLLDGLLVGMAVILVLAVTGTDFVDAFDTTGDGPAWPALLITAAGVVYEIWLTSLTGQTVGKRLLSIQVVDAETGEVPRLDQAARRIAPAIVGLVPYVGFLGVVMYLPALWDGRRQGFHDRFANTIVIDRRRAAPEDGPLR